MSRTPLSTGSTVQAAEGSSYTYIIDRVIGDGASSIVYEAHYIDNASGRHQVRLKECYPYASEIARVGTELKWTDSAVCTEDKAAFTNAYHKLLDFQNTTKLRNSTAHIFDLCEANGTLYSVMDVNEGKTFEEDNSEKLTDILKTTLALTRVVEKYHNNGYLHLDIKPSNFLVIPETRELVILFDVDSVTAIEDIKRGRVKFVPYSKGWAAPEQMQGKIDKLCPATDIYSIGAILFQKVMGRSVENEDIGIFADWDFDGEMFDDINPKIKRLLRDIFKRTLSANINRRYSTAGKLINDLEIAIKTAESEIYLKCNEICCSGRFIGREKELSLIKESFEANKKAVFLHGFAGIGKTEIARRYAELYKKDYDVILFVRYDNNLTLQDKLDEIDIVNFEGDTIEHRRKLRSLLDDKTLVIVDNFDVEIGVDNTLKVLLDSKAHILVSTRTDFSSIYSGNSYAIIEIAEFENKELEQIFLYNAKLNAINEPNKKILNKIFKLIDNHTYATELLAKQMHYSEWSYEFLYEKVKIGFASLRGAEKIVVNKDEDVKKDNSLNILRAIYHISDLTDGQKQTLRNIFMLRFMNITKRNYIKYTFSVNLEDVNTLIEIGLVQYDRLFCKLHPLLEELVHYDLNPNMANCKGIYNMLEIKIFDTSHYDGYDDADEFEFEANCDFLCGFFKYANLNDAIIRSMLINWLLDICENENIRSGEFDDWRFSPLYEKLIFLCSSEEITSIEKYNVYYVVLLSWLTTLSRIYVNNPEMTKSHRDLVEQKVRQFLPLAVSCCDNIEYGKEDYINKLYSAVIQQIASEHFGSHMKIVDDIYNVYPKAFETLTAWEKQKLGLDLSESELDELGEIPDVFKSGYTDPDVELELSCEKRFRESDDKPAYFREIINSSEYTPIKRAELLNHCINSVFDRIYFEYDSVDPLLFDWHMLEQLLDLEEEFLISDECDPTEREEIDNWNHYIETNTINQIIVYAATNKIANFEKTMELFLKEIGRKIAFYIEHGMHWTRFVSIRDFETFSISRLNNALSNIKKSHLMLPYLIQISNGWDEYATKIDQHDERHFFSLYKSIAECAEMASCETINNPDYARDFSDIEYLYRDKMDSIAGVDFTLKIEDE